jgi:hypothetical protein
MIGCAQQQRVINAAHPFGHWRLLARGGAAAELAQGHKQQEHR